MNIKTALGLSGIALLGALLVDTWAHSEGSSLLFFAITAYIAIAYFGITLWQKKSISIINSAFIILAPLLTIWLIFRDSTWLAAFSVLNGLALLVIFTANVHRKKIEDLIIHLSVIPRTLGIVAHKALEPVSTLIEKVTHKKLRGDVALGIAIGLPVVIIIGLLLISADLVVQHYLAQILENLDEVLQKIFTHSWIILYFIVLSGLFVSFTREATDREKNNEVSSISQTVARVIAVMVASVVLLFIGFQVRYLFGDAALVEELGISYQEYARTGFFQMLIAAGIIFSVIWYQVRAFADLPKKERLDVKYFKFDNALAFIMIAEVAVLLISSFKRVWLFIDTLQWATKRFFAMEGMIFMAVMLIVFTAYIVMHKFTRQQFLYIFVIAFSLNTLFLNILNPDKFIAQWNVNEYVNGAEEYELDFDYSAYVSHDAPEAGVELFYAARTEKEKIRAAYSLQNAWLTLKYYKELTDADDGWKHYDASKEHAYEIVSAAREDWKSYADKQLPEEYWNSGGYGINGRY